MSGEKRICWRCGMEEPDHDPTKHGPVCSQHKMHPHDCFRLHYPHAFREDRP